MRFGVSTHLFHDVPLERDHLAHIAAHGFEAIELFATRSHFDYHDDGAIGRLAGWLTDTGLRLASVHAPITAAFAKGDQWEPTFSNAVRDRDGREAAVREAGQALRLAERIPFEVLVVHLGMPTAREAEGDNHRAAALRSLEEICALAETRGVKVAVEVIPNKLSDAAGLATLLERDLEVRHAGICFDFGHAHLMGDVVDAIETAAEHIIATHVHDNRGREDSHLVPGAGTIDWNAALIAMQKIGYAGTYLMELANTSSPDQVLERARTARQRFERALADA
ncbi:MAG: sugar phosphate isomerase/epimerase [Vicinamibacterales bacterium]